MIRVPDGTLRVLVQGLRRIRLERRVLDDPYLVGEFVELPDVLEETKELEALTRNVQSLFGRIIGLVPYLPEELQLAAANVDDPSALCHPRRVDAPAEDGREAAAARARRRRAAAARGVADPQPRARGVRARDEDPVAGPVGAREGPARVLPAPAAEGDPGRSSARATRSRPSSTSCAARIDELDLPEEVEKAALRELVAARAAAVGRGRVRRHPHVSRLDRDAAVGR